MTMRLTKTIENIDDLIKFEFCLRTLYNTTRGVHCQALLTTAYLRWRQQLVRSWSKMTRDREIPDTTHRRASEDDTKDPLQTYLPGFRLVYEHNKCTVYQLLPHQCHTHTHMDADKKRKLCIFEEQ
jgi:hypothetical protein